MQGIEEDHLEGDKQGRSRRTRLEKNLVRRVGESILVDTDDAGIQSLEIAVAEADVLIGNKDESGARRRYDGFVRLISTKQKMTHADKSTTASACTHYHDRLWWANLQTSRRTAVRAAQQGREEPLQPQHDQVAQPTEPAEQQLQIMPPLSPRRRATRKRPPTADEQEEQQKRAGRENDFFDIPIQEVYPLSGHDLPGSVIDVLLALTAEPRERYLFVSQTLANEQG